MEILKKLLKDKKQKTNLVVVVSVLLVCALGVFAYILLMPFATKKVRRPEEYVISPGAYAAFNLIAVNGNELAVGEVAEVRVDVKTSGEEFDAATAIVEWDASVFDLEDASDVDVAPTGVIEDNYSGYLEGSNNRYVVAQFVTVQPTADNPFPYMQTPAGVSSPFYTLRFRLKEDLASLSVTERTIKLSTLANDLALHFAEEAADTNFIDQTQSTSPLITYDAGVPETFGYFEIEASNADNNYEISPGEEVQITFSLTTSQDPALTRGEEFDVATAMLKWNYDVFEYIPKEPKDTYEDIDIPPTNLPPDQDEEYFTTFVGGFPGKRMIVQWVETPVDGSQPIYMSLPIDAERQIPTYDFYRMTLRFNPSIPLTTENMTVSLAQDNVNDLNIHFAKFGDQEINSIDQSQAIKTSITFNIPSPSPSPSPSYTPLPSVSYSPSPSYTPLPSVSYSPSPSYTPLPSPSASAPPQACGSCNLNGDNEIGYADLIYLLNRWDDYPDAFAKLICILYNWGTSCP